MPEHTPDHAHDHLAHRLHEADAVPDGMAKCEELERLTREADAAGYVDLGVSARLSLINAYRSVRRYDLMLAPFAWLRATESRTPEHFEDYELHSFTWMHKWLPGGLLGDPRFSLAQITSVVDDLADRYQRHGYSAHPVHDLRRVVAEHIGDTDAADAHYAEFRSAESDDMSDCPACVVDSHASHLVARGRHKEAIEVARPVLARESTCAEQPQRVLTTLLDAYLATGRAAEAGHAHLAAYRVIRGTAHGRSSLYAHMAFCAVTGNVERGLTILSDHIDVLSDPPNPKVLMHFAASAALLLSRVPDPGAVSFTLAGASLPAAELRGKCLELARETAARFDERNGTDAVSVAVEKVIARPDAEPVLTATPSAPEARVERPDPADVVELAERACAALDEGALFGGARLLARVPEDMAPLLPEPLAARVAMHRVWLSRGDGPEALIGGLTAVLSRLEAAGEDASVSRLHSFLGELLASVDRHEEAERHVEAAFSVARRIGDAAAVVRAHLAAADLSAGHDPEAAAAEVDAAEKVALEAAPVRLGGVRNARADLLERNGDREGALAVLDELESRSDEWTESTRFAIGGHRARLLATLGHVEAAMEQFERVVELARSCPGPWLAETLLQWSAMLDQTDLAGENLPVLLDAVATSRAYLPAGAVAHACLHLAAGYLAVGRYVEAAETLEEALRLMPAEAVGAVADVHYRLAIACRNLDEHDAAAQHFDTVLHAADENEHGLRGHLLFQLGEAYLELGESGAAARSFAASADRWRLVDNPVAASESLVKLAQAEGTDDLAAGLSTLDTAVALVSDDEHPGAVDQRADALGFRAALLAHHGHFAEALTANQEAEAYAVRLGNPEWHAFLAGRAGRIRLDMGDAGAAESDARRAAALLEPDSTPNTVAVVLGTLVRTLEEQGKNPDVDDVVRELTARL